MTTTLVDNRHPSLKAWLSAEWPGLLVVAVLISLPFIWLDADPNVFKRPGDLMDSEGVVIGSLRLVHSFVIGRGAADFHMNLYEISDPRQTGCAPLGGG
jgi:hypothetical protein